MVLIIVAWVGATTLILFNVLKRTVGLRVSREEEIQGLDILEHGLEGYVYEDNVVIDSANTAMREGVRS